MVLLNFHQTLSYGALKVVKLLTTIRKEWRLSVKVDISSEALDIKHVIVPDGLDPNFLVLVSYIILLN